MNIDKSMKLLNRLLEKSLEGQLRWDATSNINAYQVKFPHYRIMITTAEDFDIEVQELYTLYIIRIISIDNVLIKEIKSNYIKKEIPFAEKLMEEIYNVAKRRTGCVEKAIDDILEDLEDDF